MKKLCSSLIIAAALFGATVPATALAAPPDHSMPGTPGEANCHGQTMAYFNFIIKEARKSGAIDFSGIGNLARNAELTVPGWPIGMVPPEVDMPHFWQAVPRGSAGFDDAPN